MTIPRPHADLIKQWADDDSLSIEMYSPDHARWIACAAPHWLETMQYRIKPSTAAAVAHMFLAINGHIGCINDHAGWAPNVRITFDQQGNPVAAEIIKSEVAE